MDGIQAIDVMPTKFNATNTGCVLCGFEEKDSRRRTKLNGRVLICETEFAVYWISRGVATCTQIRNCVPENNNKKK